MNNCKDDDNSLKYRFTAWLEIVLRNGRFLYLRKEAKRIQTVSIDDVDPNILFYEMKDVKVEDFFFENEKVYNAYKELSYMRKKVLYLLFVKEKTIVEISKELNIPCAYVSNLKYYALKNLREMIEKWTKQ